LTDLFVKNGSNGQNGHISTQLLHFFTAFLTNGIDQSVKDDPFFPFVIHFPFSLPFVIHSLFDSFPFVISFPLLTSS
jgi:hypothetical protein